jgi:hypothetical protein
MYLVSHYAGWGRGFWISVDNGCVDVHANNENVHIQVQHGQVVRKITRIKDKCTTLKYGKEHTVRKAEKVIKQEFFEPGTLQAIKRGCLYKKQAGIAFCGTNGTVECFSTSGGARGKEVFKYDNGVQAYTAAIWRKKLLLRRPNGRLWAEVIGKVPLSNVSIAERLDLKATDLGLTMIVRQNNWSVKIYDTSGEKIVTQGNVENRQKQGKWLEKGRTIYYLSGVPVSRELYEESPEKWDAYEVLKIPNSQLRCSLLTKMGYNRLIEKVKPRVIETSADGGELLEIDTHADEGNFRGLDRIMRVIKVICPSTGQNYVLRVPPSITGYEQARQWTFGLREESIKEGTFLELAQET